MAEGVEIGTAYVTILPDGSRIGPEVKKSLGVVDDEATRVGRTSGKKFGGMFSSSAGPEAGRAGSAAGKKFGGLFSSTASKVIGAAGGVFAAAKLTNFLGDSLGEAREAAQVGRRTDNVIRSMGNASKISAKQVGDLSTAISNKIGVDDEAIQSGANLLLTFGKVRNETGKGNRIFDRTTRLMADMSAAMGTDMKGSAIQLGKALNDPVKGMSALTRVGVSFTNQQKLVVKALVEGGDANALMAMGLVDSNATFQRLIKANGNDVAKTVQKLTSDLTDAQKKRYEFLAEGGHQLEAQKTVLKEVEKQFKGAGEAAADPAKKLQVAYGNLKEQIGTALLPTVENLEKKMTNKVIPAVSTFLDEMQTGKGKGGQAVELFKTIRDDAEQAGKFVGDIAKKFNDLPDPVKKGALLGAAGLYVGKKTGLGSLLGSPNGKGGAGSGLLGLVTKAKPLPVYVVNQIPGAGGTPIAGAARTAAAAEAGAASGAAGAASKAGRFARFGRFAKFFEIPLPALGSQTGDLTKKNPFGLKALPYTPDLMKFASRATEIQNGVKAVDALDHSLAGLAMRRPGQALAEFEDAAKKTHMSTADLAKVLPNAAKALDRAGIDAKNADGKVFGLGDSTRGAVRELKFLSQQQPQVTIHDNTDKVKKRIFSLKEAIEDATVPRTAHIRVAISQASKGITGGFGIQRASGGPAYAGQQYTVNEHLTGLREQFVPGVDGRILSRRDAMAALAGRSGPAVQISGVTIVAQDFNDVQRNFQKRALHAAMGGS